MTDPAAEETSYLKDIADALAQPVQTVLTLRDHFALAALASMLRDPHNWTERTETEFATAAYEFADAMLKARERTPA